MEADSESEYQISFTHSLASVNSLGSRLWLSSINNPRILWIVLPAIALLLYFLNGGVDEALRQASLPVGFLGGVFSLASFQLVQSYVSYIRYWQRWINKTVEFRFDVTGVEYSSAIWSGKWPWQSFSALWRRKDVWLLYVDESPVIILPVFALPHEIQEHIASKIDGTGGRIF